MHTVTHPSGCPLHCRRSHLTESAASRVVEMGVPLGLLMHAMTDEVAAHSPDVPDRRPGEQLTPIVAARLLASGLADDELEGLFGRPGPILEGEYREIEPGEDLSHARSLAAERQRRYRERHAGDPDYRARTGDATRRRRERARDTGPSDPSRSG